MDKEARLKELFKRWIGCKRCPLHEKRRNIVFGQGNPDADILVIGIGPGEEEDKTGNPFWGPSGDILDEFLAKNKYSRGDLFLLNIVACRPTAEVLDPVTKRKKIDNRDPAPIERASCQELWLSTLYIVDPMLIVALGKPAVAELSKQRGIQMYKEHGKITDCELPGLVVPIRYPVMTMYHPAFLARSGDKTYGGVWHQALVDWRRAIYYVDQLRYIYYREKPLDRGFDRLGLFINTETLEEKEEQLCQEEQHQEERDET